MPNCLVERQAEPEVQALLDVVNKEIVQAVQHTGFDEVLTVGVRERAAIRVSFCSGRTLAEGVDAMFETIVRSGRLLNKKVSVR